MASTSGISTIVIGILIFTVAIINIVIVSAVRESELNVVFGVLRARGYHLFANAIATSDIHYDIKSNGNFTLLAPINSALFAIDMTMAASNYVEALRYHVVPRRMSISDLLSLPPGLNTVPTLMPGQDIIVEQRRSPRSLITVGGVDIVVPGMFYGRDIAVHGLDGILEYRPHARNSVANITGGPLTNFSGNLNIQSPITDLPDNLTSMNADPYANIPPPNSTQEVPPPQDYNPMGNVTFQFPMDGQSPPPSDLTPNPSVTYPVEGPTSDLPSDLPPLTDGTAMDFAPSPDQSPTDSTYFDLEQTPRAKLLLELTSVGRNDLSPPTKRTSNNLQQFTPADDETVDCSPADKSGYPIHARKLYIASPMICAQK